MSMVDNIKDLETKQKIMLVAIVVLVGFIIYFGYTTFFPQSNNVVVAPTVAPVKSTTAQPTQTASPQAAVKPPVSSTTSNESVTQTPQLQKVSTPTTSAPTPEQLALLAESQQLQTEYLHLVNQYQVAQLQQKLATTDAKIAAQKLAATKSYLATQKLTGGSNSMPTSIFGGTTKAVAPPMQVMYVGQQGGVWAAMLGRSGNYFQVKVGTQLPDGSVVQSISNQGVILNKNGQNQYLVIPKTLDSTSSN